MPMTRMVRLVLVALAGASLAAPGGSASAQGAKTFKARLSPVAIDLTMMATIAGGGSVTAVLTGNKLAITGSFDGLKSSATVAQVHKSPVTGVPGPSIVDLACAHDMSGSITGTLTLTAQQVADLEKGRLYVQLSSERAPDGNLWGWLLPEKKR
jgi:hypothetical protein